MKIYKLLQKYPSLPNDWEVGMEVGLGDRNYGYSPCAGNFTDCRKLENPEVENNPGFWELVSNKDYEIVSINTNSYFGITTSTLDTDAFENGRCKDKKYQIHSVKRLSDGEIFTIGDIIDFDNKGAGKLLRIDFERAPVDKGTGKLCFVNDNLYLGDWWNIKALTKVKEPLLVTEDGVKLFEGDTFYIPQKDSKGDYSGRVLEFKAHTENTIRPHGKTFADKEKAKEWIELNKKQYSLSDMVSIANHWAYIKVVKPEHVLKTVEKWKK